MSKNESSKDSSDTPEYEEFEFISRKWCRNPNGTYEVSRDKNGNPQQHKLIASHAVRIVKVLFVIKNRGVKIHYVLAFHNRTGSVEVRMQHTDLNDEKSFLNAAPPGFALSAAHRAFQKLRELLMHDLIKANHVGVLTRSGWYRWKGKFVYAHAGGVISSDWDVSGNDAKDETGTTQAHDLTDIDEVCSNVPILVGNRISIDKVLVELPEQFTKYRFDRPESKADAQSAVRMIFEFLKMGDPNVAYTTIPALFFTALRDPRFAVFLYGETGSLKTAYALLLLSFFMEAPQERDLPSFISTENALRARFAASGNVPVVMDDFTEPPGSRQFNSSVQKVDNVIRPIVNGNGKERSFGDGSLRPNLPTRGLIIVTGESFPAGLESLKRRTVQVQVDRSCFEDSIDGPRPNQFDHFQRLAAVGTFRKAMAAFIAWSAKDHEFLQSYLDDPEHILNANQGSHRRLLDTANSLLSGMGLLLDFASDLEAISDQEYDEHVTAVYKAVQSMLERAYMESLGDCPTEAFAQLLQSSMSSLRCHIEVEDISEYLKEEDGIPIDLLGYTIHEELVPIPRSSKSDSEAGDSSHEVEDDSCVEDTQQEMELKKTYRPHGSRIGWIKFDHIDLIPDAALAEANSMAIRSGATPLPTKKSFGKLLVTENWIATKSKDRNTCKVRLGSVTKDVWRIHAFRLFELQLGWGSFDVGYYKSMTAAERQQERKKQRNEIIQRFRERLTRYQVDELLNPHLTANDRDNLLRSDPPDDDEVTDMAGSLRRFKPSPPSTRSMPGYDDMEGEGLLA